MLTNSTRGVCKLVSKTQLILKRFPEPFESHKRTMLRRYLCLCGLIHQWSRCSVNTIAFVDWGDYDEKDAVTANRWVCELVSETKLILKRFLNILRIHIILAQFSDYNVLIACISKSQYNIVNSRKFKILLLIW